ncbi:O-antigen ligase family protein [Brevibacillus sp. SYSU BS000544]|uniref:O-antigen ligase family protein n=1 Tax=Brevibacillus sp. SYSU BS000544 TaxID=3416443 RepID=UPI003CE4FE31
MEHSMRRPKNGLPIQQRLLSLLTDSTNWLYLLLFYPIIDFVLRKIIPIPIVSSFWDDGVLVVLLGFALLAYFVNERPLPGIKHVLTAFFVLGLALMVSDMDNFKVSVEGFRAIYEYVLAFFVGFYLIKSTDDLNKYIKVLTFVGFIVGLIGVLQVALGIETTQGWVNEGETMKTRAYSIVTSPNVLGSYMAFIAPIAMGLVLQSKTTKDRLIWGAMALIVIAALLFTGSRGAWFAFAAVVLFGCSLWNRKIAVYLLIAGMIGLAALWALPDSTPLVGSVKNRIETLFSADYWTKSTSDGRIKRWTDAYNQMRLEPLFGAGLGHHGGAVGYRHFGTIYTDSYFFKSIAELGLLGIGLLVTLAVMIIRYCLALVRRLTNTPHYFLALGVLCGMFAVSLHNLVENIFEVPFMLIYFWLIGGFVAGLIAEKTKSFPEKR